MWYNAATGVIGLAESSALNTAIRVARCNSTMHLAWFQKVSNLPKEKRKYKPDAKIGLIIILDMLL